MIYTSFGRRLAELTRPSLTRFPYRFDRARPCPFNKAAQAYVATGTYAGRLENGVAR